MGNTATTWFTANGQPIKVREVIDGVNKDTLFYYDAVGRRTKVVDSAGNQTVVMWDSLGRTVQKSDPDSGLWQYAYDNMGRLTKETDAKNQATSLYYDNLGRVTKRKYSDNTWDQLIFDETGRGASVGRLTTSKSACSSASQTTCTATTNTVTLQKYYDVGGRTTKYTQLVNGGTTYTVSETYDVAGRVSATTYPDGEVVTHYYGTDLASQSFGRLTKVSGSVAGNILTNATYTPRGHVATLVYANGVTTTMTRDVSSERVTQVQMGSLATLAYGYDSAGQVTNIASAALFDWEYKYDTLGRLTSAKKVEDSTTRTYKYDAIGRITYNSEVGTGAYTYSAGHLHAVTNAGGTTYAYDANGNLTNGGGRVLTYDKGNRVSQIVYSSQTTKFITDADGKRVKKTQGANTVEYVGSLYEKRGTVVTKYYFAGGLRLAKRTGATPVNTFFHADHLGSTRLITSAAGAEVKRYEYKPWGAVLSETGSSPDSHRFTGQETDDETGLVFFGWRYYDPTLGRFISPDAFVPNDANPQALDLYAYVNNSPTNGVDPSGNLGHQLAQEGRQVDRAKALKSAANAVGHALKAAGMYCLGNKYIMTAIQVVVAVVVT